MGEECFECGATEPRSVNEAEALYEAGELPGAWQRCRQCDQPLCDQCVTDDEHECLRER